MATHERHATTHPLIVTAPTDTTIEVERVFDAPIEQVFRLYNDHRHIPEWWGPRRYTTEVLELDFRPGGRWRFVNRDADGSSYTFFGEYREVRAPERVTWTFNYEDGPEQACVETIDFEEFDIGLTRLHSVSVFETREARDEMMQAGMEDGLRETFERFDELLERRRGRPD